MSEAECEQLRGVISQARSPCHKADWAGQEVQERPRLLKDTNRWEAAVEGGGGG